MRARKAFEGGNFIFFIANPLFFYLFEKVCAFLYEKSIFFMMDKVALCEVYCMKTVEKCSRKQVGFVKF